MTLIKRISAEYLGRCSFLEMSEMDVYKLKRFLQLTLHIMYGLRRGRVGTTQVGSWYMCSVTSLRFEYDVLEIYNVPMIMMIGGGVVNDDDIKGCGMGPWLVVFPCFIENVVAACKIGSFLCSLDNLLQKNVIIVFCFEIKFHNGAHLKKKDYF